MALAVLAAQKSLDNFCLLEGMEILESLAYRKAA
ncbi:hypothetical protein GGD63_001100 [Bradyrhizobium sp. cir1]|nr:hypothetical protein [Bradyrhizobium sp. cir1]